MDKLRAIEYFVCAAQTRSLSAAARKLEVSVTAISKMLSALERSLGARLFDRSSTGLTLTAAGQEYLDACRPALEQLANADAAVGRARTQASGLVTVAVQHSLAVHCLAPALPRLHARHPGIQLDLWDYVRGNDSATETADLRLTLVWDDMPDQIVKMLARTRMVVCAAPQYWAQHGLPQRPADLARHPCLAVRAPRGTVLDHWAFERAGQLEAATINAWLTTSNTNREAAVVAALAGEGVFRGPDVTLEEHLRQGRLVSVLNDWHAVDSPNVRLMYRPSAARLPRVRVVAEFLTEVFREIELRCIALTGPRRDGKAPIWAGARPYRRASSAASRS